MHSTKEQPLISIITIVYNSKNDLEKTIKSVLNQKYKNIEYIIIDGGSTDGTLDIINKYQEEIDKVISEPDNGIYDAMNKGLKHISGKWVNFLNAGDLFYDNNILNNIFQNLQQGTKLIYGDWINTSNHGLNRYITAHPSINVNTLRSNFFMNHQSLFVNTSYVVEYDTTYQIKADYQWIIEIVQKLNYSDILYINKALVLYDVDGLSAKLLLTNIKEYIKLTYRNFGKTQVIKNSPIYSIYLIKYILYKLGRRVL